MAEHKANQWSGLINAVTIIRNFKCVNEEPSCVYIQQQGPDL
jgi:hypothetical protein